MSTYNNPKMFDYYFYPKKTSIISKFLLFLLFGIVPLFIFVFLEVVPKESFVLKIYIIILFSFNAFLDVLLGVSIFRLINKVFLGVNQEGIYLKSGGMTYWDQIESMEIQEDPKRKAGKVIFIKTNIKEDDIPKPSVLELLKIRLVHGIGDILRKNEKGDLIIKEYDVDMPLDDFLKILKEYQSKYGR